MGRKVNPSKVQKEASSERQSEAAWKAMTALEHDESDRWNDVEEHLLRSGDEHKQWKYFGK